MSNSDKALSDQIKSAAQRLGFALAGISPVTVAPREESFADWLRNGPAVRWDI